jgi:phosphoribosyl 1,2-cyclic phosphate phosphodiesterase
MAGGEAIILGSGTSNGVPMLGVHYTAEFLANPKNHRMRSSCLLKGPGGNFLIDCTPEMRLQLIREEIFRVEEVLITHTHADHVMGMDDLRSFCMIEERAISVYTLPRYQEDIRRIFPYAFGEVPAGVFVPRFELHDVPKTLESCGLTIQVFEVLHGKVPCLGVRVNDFAYVTDVSFISTEVKLQLQNLDTLVLDAVRHKPHPNHFHFDAAMSVIAELKPKMAYLTHLSHEYDHNNFEDNLPANVRLAYDGLALPF